jgi:hypothetical protein
MTPARSLPASAGPKPASIESRMRPPIPLLLAVLAVPACGSDSAPPPTAFELRIESVTIRPVDGVLVPEDAVRRDIREASLRSQSFLDLRPGRVEPPVLATVVRLGEVEAATGGRVLRAEFAAAVPEEQHAVLGRVLEATIELERRDGTLVPDEDVPTALARGVSVLDAKVQLVLGTQTDAEGLLGSDDPEIVVLALEQVTRQRWRGLADPVAKLLAHGDERVVAAAVECLGVVGGPRHTAALLRHVRLADVDQARRLYDTLAALGGDEARGFLEFAARNEDDPAMAEVATRALHRLGLGPDEGTMVEAPVPLRGHRP